MVLPNFKKKIDIKEKLSEIMQLFGYVPIIILISD